MTYVEAAVIKSVKSSSGASFAWAQIVAEACKHVRTRFCLPCFTGMGRKLPNEHHNLVTTHSFMLHSCINKPFGVGLALQGLSRLPVPPQPCPAGTRVA
eukprot:1344414-Amphidinium_carterae.1